MRAIGEATVAGRGAEATALVLGHTQGIANRQTGQQLIIGIGNET